MIEEFLKYFWSQEGYQYDPLEGQIFQTYHLNMLLITLVFLILFLVIGILVNNKKRYIQGLSIVLLILEALRVYNIMVIFDRTVIAALSFHLCSIGIYFMIIAGLFNKKIIYEMTFLHALIGAPLALLIPSGILPWYHVYSFLPVQSFISHLLLSFIFIYAYHYKVFELKLHRFYIPLIGLFISIGLAYGMSLYNLHFQTGGSTNFFWTRDKDPMFDQVMNLPYPYYFYVLIRLLIAVGAVVYVGMIGSSTIFRKRKSIQ